MRRVELFEIMRKDDELGLSIRAIAEKRASTAARCASPRFSGPASEEGPRAPLPGDDRRRQGVHRRDPGGRQRSRRDLIMCLGEGPHAAGTGEAALVPQEPRLLAGAQRDVPHDELPALLGHGVGVAAVGTARVGVHRFDHDLDHLIAFIDGNHPEVIDLQPQRNSIDMQFAGLPSARGLDTTSVGGRRLRARD